MATQADETASAGEPGVAKPLRTSPRRGLILRVYGDSTRSIVRPLRGRGPGDSLTPGSLRSPGAIQDGSPAVTEEYE